MRATVLPDQIEQTLQQAWDEAENTDRVKAALFNLVTYVADPDRLERLNQLLVPLTHRFPCRMLMLIEDRTTSEPFLTTQVGMDLIGDPNHRVSSDQIVLQFSSHERERVPFLLTPHLLPHLPIYLLWTGMPNLTDPLYSLLEHQLTEVIFDPPDIARLPAFAQGLLAAIAHIPGGASDLCWAETQGWRQILGMAFHSRERHHELQTLTRLDIVYADDKDELGRDTALGATYIQAWLAAQLGWKYEGRDGSLFTYDPTRVTLQAEPRGQRLRGTILEIRGTSANGYQFALTIDAAGEYAQFNGGSEQICEIPTSLYLGHKTREQVLAKELFQRGTSEHYRNTLHLIGRYDDSYSS